MASVLPLVPTAQADLKRQTSTPEVALMRKQLEKIQRDMEVLVYTLAATRECYEPERQCHECLGGTSAPSTAEGFDDEGTDDGDSKERREFDELMDQIQTLQQQVALQTQASQQLRTENEQLQAECALLQEQQLTDTDNPEDASPASLKLTDAEVARLVQLSKDNAADLDALQQRLEEVTRERDHLRQERDTALLSAEKAWKENATLAGHTNPGQKIKYVQQLKDENNKLHQQLRDAEARLALQSKRQPLTKTPVGIANGEWNDVSSNTSEATTVASTTTLKPSKMLRKKVSNGGKSKKGPAGQGSAAASP
ncbi:hypothetical protein H310_03928 [Aphanomyces invadans]|uniref:Hyaluronan-mediated motility receptor C-terminal domain-containing protein n=1 Tax=Aphanomyces invadans TaxID=157072 RepID=A0A024UEG2_9STRA|nr:hypothetical protein H310_03928 [Aphanomyces invadans]ETW04791.1 hypothetical protein H310_03928 [Aphanomyces invadans]RHY30186.1 hypothetical protein DYB32_004572 [Aphanomyces invadans]|eukprot:XP_008866229.1 hypothetical protein H310_03928 [Aphanomyces invadans]